MNRRLHGNRTKQLNVKAAGIILALLSFLIPAHEIAAEEDVDRLSGVVTPKVSVLKQVVASDSPRIEEYRLPTRYSVPAGLAIDSKDRVWFTEMAGNSLAVFDPETNQLKEYRIPSTVGLEEVEWQYDPKKREMPEKTINIFSVGNPGNIIIGKDGLVWFVMQLGNSVVRFDPSKEEFTEFIIPTQNSRPYDLAADSKGRIWFIEKNGSKIGYLDMEKKKIYEIELEKDANLMGIAIDRDDNVWVGDVMHNYIGRYNPQTKKIRKFLINTPLAQPGIMKFDKSGKLWFCQVHAKQIGVFFPDPGIFSVADMPGFNAVPQALAPSDDEKIWFVDSMMNRVGYFDAVTLKWGIFPIPTINSQPMDIEIDSKGDIWFTQSGHKANKIARLVRSTVPEAEALSGGGATGATDRGKKGWLDAQGSTKSKRVVSLVIAGAVIFIAIVLGFLYIRRPRSID